MAILLPSTANYGRSEAFARQRRVMVAVMLRNIRTRFFAHGFGYVIALAWPLIHTLVITVLYAYGGRAPPVGDSALIFIATAMVPFNTFAYMSRFMVLSLISTRPLLSFPAVKVLDVLFASAILEILSTCLVTLILLTIAWAFDVTVAPRDIVGMSEAFGVAVLFGLGVGILNGVISLGIPMWPTIYTLLVILAWMTSGAIFVPDSMPEAVRNALSYHPALQLTEWMRSSYYEGYTSSVLDRGYVIQLSLGMVVLGLLVERLARGRLLATK